MVREKIMNTMRKWMNLFEAESIKNLSYEEIENRLWNCYHCSSLTINADFSSGELIFNDDLQTKKYIDNLADIDFSVGKSIVVRDTRLKDLTNFPKSVTGDVKIIHNPLLETLKGIQYIKSNDLSIYGNPMLKSLEGIEPNIKVLYIFIGYLPSLPMLRLLVAKESIFVKNLDNSYNDAYKPLQNIFNKYIQDKNMSLSEKRIRCKLELLEYPEYRKNAEW